MAASHVWINRLQKLTDASVAQLQVALPRCPGLSPDERIIIATIRLMVSDGLEATSPCAAIALKPGGELVLGALQDWLGVLARKAARQIAVGAPQHCCASPDELAMLVLIDAARRGQFSLVHRMLAQLVAHSDIDALAHASEHLAAELHDAGFRLTPRSLPDRPHAA